MGFPRYPLRYTPSGHIFIGPEDDCDAVVDAMLLTGYSEEYCAALDFSPAFASRLMEAGFLLMSARLGGPAGGGGGGAGRVIMLPKFHLLRAVLPFPELHVKRSVRRLLPRYELRFNEDFEEILGKCVSIHGQDWLTNPLLGVIRGLYMEGPWEPSAPYAVSFGVYREGALKAGEFGVICGGVYTSYSGYHEESGAGTAQLILMCRFLEERGFAFLDLGMPLDYKTALGARNIPPEEFVPMFREGRGRKTL